MKNLHRGLALAACIGCSLFAIADHLPPGEIARGNPEHVLSGVDIYRTKMQEVIHRLGNPTAFEDLTDNDYPKGSGERHYTWIHGATTLHVNTEYYTDPTTHKIVESAPMIVDVRGESSTDGFGATGQGLTLGSGLDKLESIYGKKFQKDDTGETLQWKDETTLYVWVDKTGRIDRMQLEASVE